MADKAPTRSEEVAAPASGADAPASISTEVKSDEAKPEADNAGAAESAAENSTDEKAAENTIEESNPEKDTTEKDAADTDVQDAADTTAAEGDAAAVAAAAATSAETPTAKAKGTRRKSGGAGLSRKGSKARLTHTDAKPGDHFLVKLKGFPAWPAIICDEAMLPWALLNSRPVSALRPDGTYSEPFADGGKRVNDRTFPVMYLHTNEFGWEKNTNLSELSAEKAKATINDKMRKDLKAAFELAIEHHPVDFYKAILKSYEDELIAQEEARKEAAATPKKSKKGKSKAAEEDEGEGEGENTELIETEPPAKKSKKRKADEAATPQRSGSVKKTKIKINTSSTPKTTNGAAPATTPKSAGASSSKTAAKVKAKKPKETKETVEKKAEGAKESKLSPEERHGRKVREVLFLRHKLQKGLLTREEKPQEQDMPGMHEYIKLLEKFGNLEVSIIRETKINKVLKAVLKLDVIPREAEFQFKKRSQVLLDKWNKLLASEASANGVNGSESHGDGKKTESNGVKADGDAKSAEPATTESKASKAEEAEVAKTDE